MDDLIARGTMTGSLADFLQEQIRRGKTILISGGTGSGKRWRPDRIILGEVRGIEARTLLDSFNTGHAGSLATIHANSAEKALHRFANLVMRNHAQTTFTDTEAEIGESVDFVVHIERQPGGRVIREVLRMIGYDRDTKRFLIEPVFEVQHAAA